MSSSFPSFLPRHLLHGVGPLRRCGAVHVTRCFSLNGAAGRRVGAPLTSSVASIATPGNSNALHVGARFYVARDTHDASARAEEPELISLDCIEVITTTVETSGDAAETKTATTSSPTDTTAANATVTVNASHFTVHDVHPHQQHKEQVGASADFTATTASTAPYSSDTSREAATAYCDVHDVDTFARSRIANFMRRMGHTKGDIFHVREVQETHASSGATHAVFVATCCVPLPPPHHSRMAEGVGESRKEAELLAAMHAERLCDALGVPLFRLRTAQQKHAEAVRAREGRYAPMPDDPVKPLGTPVPPPLRLLRTPPQPPPPSPSASLSGHEVNFAADSTAEKSEKQSHSTSSSASAPASSQPATSVVIKRKTSAATATTPLAKTDNATPDQSGATSRPPETSPESTAATRAEDATEWPTPTATPFFTSDAARNETRCRDARLLFNTFVRPISDAAHAERVASYASTVVYPWESGWVEAPDAHATTPMRGEGRANAYAAVPSVTYDPTEGGMWQMVNDRNLRCSPTPQDALVLPYVFDGPHAVARLTDYYLQHGTTLGEHLTVRSVAAPGTQARQSEAELRLIGVTVAARGKSQTEEMAVGLAAMHAELLLDALGLPLFPADAQRQSRHAAVVTGYGRWAMDPLNGATASPNLHDALPLPLKSQVGTDDVWLDASAPLQLRSKRTESERIVAAQNFIIHKSDCMLEVNPPNELLEEAYTMLREWQTHIARSRYTNLFVLFNMECNVYRATTLTPVPARFGLRGGNSVATTHEKAVRLCALNAMDTLASLGVPLCVDAEQERRYLQRRAALGHVLPNMLDGVKHLKGGIPYLPGSSRTKLTRNALAHLGPESTREKSGLPYIPTYLWEGQQTRMMPALVDYQHVTQLKVPQDYCLFSSSNDFAMNEAGNEAKVCVCNYLEQCHAQRVRDLTTLLQKMAVKKFDYPYTPDSSSNDLGVAEDEVSRLASVIGSRTAAADRAVLRNDALLQTQLWAVLKYHTTSPSVYVTGYVSTVAVHSIAFLSIPVLHQRRSKGQVEDRRERRGHEGASTSDDVGAIAELEELLNGPDYVIAVGISLKRRDAVRACYVHAVNLLKRMGLDVLAKYTAGASRSRHVPNHEALSQYVSVDPPTVVLPFTHDGEVNTTPLEIPVSTLPAEQRPPLAVMHKLLKMYMEDARHVTPRRRPAAKKKTGFFRATQGKW